MKMIASTKCGSVEQRNFAIERLSWANIKPKIDGLNLELEYELPEGSWPMLSIGVIELIIDVFEKAGDHSISFLS